MKRFIKNATLYALIFLVTLSFLAYAGFHLARHKILQNFPETENIILGDSNSQRAVDDAKLNSTKNFSSTAENYRRHPSFLLRPPHRPLRQLRNFSGSSEK